MSDNKVQTPIKTDSGTYFFWLLWILALALLPFYGLTFFFEAGVMKDDNLGSKISPVIGLLVLFAQLAITIISYRQKRSDAPLSRPYLTLLGGTIIIGLVWAGGCSIMGPWNLH